MTLYDVSAMLAVLLFIGAAFLFICLLQPERDFSLDRDKIQVLNVHFAVTKNGSTTNMVAFGLVTNESEHSWAVDQFEIRYLGTKGKLLAADHEAEYFTILPKSDHSFRLDLDSDAFFPGYEECKVRVISASDPRASFQLFGN